MSQGEGKNSINRRRLLAGVGVAGAALAPDAKAQSSSAPAPSPAVWDRTVDVVVVGSGAAGFSAAATAHSLGRSVVVLEKGAVYGGTTAKSGGMYWIPNNSLMRAKGLEDPRDWALRFLARLAYPTLYDPTAKQLGLPPLEYELIEAFYDRGPEAIDHLAKIGALNSMLGSPPPARARIDDGQTLLTWPDYHSDLPENRLVSGRALTAGGRGGAIVAQLKRYADGHEVPVLLEHRVTRAYRNAEGAVVGVGVEAPGGKLAIRARKGVVFASGGFTHNEALRRAYLRGPVLHGYAAATNTGDLIPIAAELGAAFGNMSHAWWMQQPLEMALAQAEAAPETFMPTGDSMLMVNRQGVRVVNERRQYNERTQVHFDWDPTAREYGNLVLFMIYDEATAQDPDARFPIPRQGQAAAYVITGQTLTELAGRVDARLKSLAGRTGGFALAPDFAGGLQATVARFNRMAAAGKDTDFHRGESVSQLFFSRTVARPGQKNRSMYPLAARGPYYCIPLVAGTLDTKGGPKINPDAQILDWSGAPIPGLYGAGNCIASPAGQAYWSAGGTIGPALTFGYLAGRNAAGRPDAPA